MLPVRVLLAAAPAALRAAVYEAARTDPDLLVVGDVPGEIDGSASRP